MKLKAIVPIFALIVAAAVAAAWWYQRNENAPSTALQLHGNVDIRQVELAFNGSERIGQVLAREGDRVRKDQVLAVLDTERLQQAVAQAAAQVGAQQQVVARLVAGSRPQEIRKAQADLQAARVDLRNARSTYERDQELAGKHFISQQQADNSRAAADAAEARLNALQEALRLVQEGSRKEDIAAAKSTLAAYEAALALAQRILADASLRAPADGVIEKRILEPGDMASPQKAVFTLALTDPLWVRAYVSETDLGKLHTGVRAEITTDSFPGKRYRGWIGFISPTAEFTPKSVETREVRTALVYQVRAFVCAHTDELRLGMPATVTVALDQPPPAAGADPCKTGQ
ncbi:MAG: efflux RND transporter periplasmic adaptor subunit [Gemmatimonadota bacterium]